MNLFGLTSHKWLDIGISPAILVGALIFISVISTSIVLGYFDIGVSGLVAILGIGSLAFALGEEEG